MAKQLPGLASFILGIQGIEESSTYQAIFAQGEVKGRWEGKIEGALLEARKILFCLGERRLGEPSDATIDAIEAIPKAYLLEPLIERLDEVTTWEELIPPPSAAKKRRRRKSS